MLEVPLVCAAQDAVSGEHVGGLAVHFGHEHAAVLADRDGVVADLNDSAVHAVESDGFPRAGESGNLCVLRVILHTNLRWFAEEGDSLPTAGPSSAELIVSIFVTRCKYCIQWLKVLRFYTGDTVTGMNEQVREAVKKAMGERELSQGELARRLEVDRPSITRLLSGTSGKVPKLWQEVLDSLDLELIAVPKKDSTH